MPAMVSGTKTRQPAKPLLLALETSGQCGSIALVTPERCLAEYSLNSPLTHSRRLLAGMQDLLNAAGFTLEDLDGLAVSIGPGSFTGLRIGLGTIKGLAMATCLPLITIPTLDGLAAQLPFATGHICPIIDARKKEVFAAIYQRQAGGELQRTTDYLAIAPARLAERIQAPTIFIGDGILPYQELFQDKLGSKAIFAPTALYFARAASIGMLALDRWQSQDCIDPHRAVPLYVRASEAEVNLLKKEGAPTR
jgi:tRNA threonylcarbamoyladenosine biosynthesis protein TsaB